MKIKIVLFYLLLISAIFAQDSTYFEIAPGVHYSKITRPEIPLSINILKVDLRNDAIELNTALAGGVVAKEHERTSVLAEEISGNRRYTAAGVNADFFHLLSYENRYRFLGNSMISDGDIVYAENTGRSVFALTKSGKPAIDMITFHGNIVSQYGSYEIAGVNAYRDSNTICLYNRYGGTRSKNGNGTELLLTPLESVDNNGSTAFLVTEEGTAYMEVNDGYLLSGSYDGAEFLALHVPGDTITLSLSFKPCAESIEELTGGGPRLLTNGVIPESFIGAEGFNDRFTDVRHPRTAVGFSKDSTTLYLVTVDGRLEGFSVGMTLTELAEYMLALGCYQALNFDGGGSTTMVLRDSVVNSPSDLTGERPVGNALFISILEEIPSLIQYFDIKPDNLFTDLHKKQPVTYTAIDKWNFNMDIPMQLFEWESKGIQGAFTFYDENDLVLWRATLPGKGIVTGKTGSSEDSIYVEAFEELRD